MSEINVHGNAAIEVLLPAAARTASENGAGVDAKDYDGVVKIIATSAAGTGTAPTLDIKIQDSADNTTFTDVSGATFTQIITASTASIGVNVSGTKRYIRAVTTIGGTSPSFTCAVIMAGQKQAVSA